MIHCFIVHVSCDEFAAAAEPILYELLFLRIALLNILQLMLDVFGTGINC
jgi:hypothetical protein